MENEQMITEKAPAKKKYTTTMMALQTTHGLNNIVSIFVSTFLISYIYSISNNYVMNIGLFYAFNYIAMGVMYFVVSSLIDKTNRVWFYRLAIVVRAAFILSVIFVGEKLAHLVILAGALHGFSEACYWTSYNLMKNELVSKSLIKKYSINQMMIEKSVSIIIPLVLGSLIDAESFKSSAIIVLVIAVIEMIVSMFIKSKRPKDSSFNFKEFIQRTKALGEQKCLVADCVVNGGLYGFVTTVSPMATIMIMYSFGSNFSLGLLTSVFSFCAMVFVFGISKFTRTGKRAWLFMLAAFMPLLSSLLLVLKVTKTTVIIFNLFFIVLSMVHSYTYDVARNFVIKKLGMYDSIAEFQCAIECFMAFCRVLGFLVVVAAGAIGSIWGTEGILISAKIMTVVTTLSLLVFNLRLLVYEKKLKKYHLDESL